MAPAPGAAAAPTSGAPAPAAAAEGGTAPKALTSTLLADRAKRERAAYGREKEAKAALEAANKSKADHDALLALAKTDPLGALARLGLTPAQILRQAATNGKKDPQAQIDELRAEVAAKEKTAADEKAAALVAAQTAQKNQATAEFKAQLASLLELPANIEKFELVSLEENSAGQKIGAEAVFKVIDMHFQQKLQETGEQVILDFEVAAEMVEKALEARDKRRFEKSKKLKSWYTPPQTGDPAVPAAPAIAGAPANGAKPVAPKGPAVGLKPQPTLAGATSPSSGAAAPTRTVVLNAEEQRMENAKKAFAQHHKPAPAGE